MKKFFVIVIVIVIGNNGYSQSFNQQEYVNRANQKMEKLISEINSELDRSNRFTLSQNKKEVYFLYNAEGRKFAFPDEFSCNAKIRNIEMRIHNLLDGIINSAPSRINGKSIENEKAELKRQIKTQMKMDCSCHKGNNPNYREQYSHIPRSNAFDVNSNNGVGQNNGGAPAAFPSLPQNSDVQTQYNSVPDALAAAAAQTRTPARSDVPVNINFNDLGGIVLKDSNEPVDFDFNDMEKFISNGGGIPVNMDINDTEKFVPKGSNEIYVGDGNTFKGVIPQPPIYLGDRDNYRTANLPPRQDPDAPDFVLPQEKEKGIELANSLLPKAMEKMESFEKDVALFDKNIALGEKKLFDLEKEKMLVEYEGMIVMKEGMHMPYVMKEYEPTLKEKFNMTDEELKNFRNSVYAKLPPDAVISESMNLGSHTRKALEGDGEAGSGVNVLGGAVDFLTAGAKKIELSAYDKWQKRLDGDITVLNKQLKGYYTDREKSVRDNADIQKVVSHYSNVIQNGKVVTTSKNELDAMNLGNFLHDILKK